MKKKVLFSIKLLILGWIAIWCYMVINANITFLMKIFFILFYITPISMAYVIGKTEYLEEVRRSI